MSTKPSQSGINLLKVPTTPTTTRLHNQPRANNSPTRSTRSRGRPRKPVPVPPPTLQQRITRARTHPYFYPLLALAVALVVGLIASAIRIAARQSSLEAPAPYASTASSPPARDHVNSPSTEPPRQEVLFDDVVRDVLADTWKLEQPETSDQVDASDTRWQGVGDEAAEPPKARSLQELYREVEGMGLTVDDLTSALNQAYQE